MKIADPSLPRYPRGGGNSLTHGLSKQRIAEFRASIDATIERRLLEGPTQSELEEYVVIVRKKRAGRRAQYRKINQAELINKVRNLLDAPLRRTQA